MREETPVQTIIYICNLKLHQNCEVSHRFPSGRSKAVYSVAVLLCSCVGDFICGTVDPRYLKLAYLE